jgi:hypothetical protein
MIDRKRIRDDSPVNVKVILSGMWASMLFVFAYVDIFGFWRSDVVKGALDGEVPGAGPEINQTFLALTTLYILIPSVMVCFTLMAPTKFNRPTNLVVSMLYAISVVAFTIGETWAYYVLGSVVEVVLLLVIAGRAWFWPTIPHPRASNEIVEPLPAEPDDLQWSRTNS